MEDLGNFWTALPSILWFLLVIVVLMLFRRQLINILTEFTWRIKTGASVKIASWLEVGAAHVSPGDFSEKTGLIEIRVDETEERYKQRRQYYEPNRNIHLVHRLAPAKQPGQLYDIYLYLIPHKDASLSGVQKVEYYFGRHWGNRIFTSIDRARGFAISTSAFGPFMCTAKVHFTDGESVMLNRYVDFEMGASGPIPYA